MEDVIRELRGNDGFSAFAIMSNDGIVIKYENMDYRTAVHYSHQVLDLCAKAKRFTHLLLDPPDVYF